MNGVALDLVASTIPASPDPLPRPRRGMRWCSRRQRSATARRRGRGRARRRRSTAAACSTRRSPASAQAARCGSCAKHSVAQGAKGTTSSTTSRCRSRRSRRSSTTADAALRRAFPGAAAGRLRPPRRRQPALQRVAPPEGARRRASWRNARGGQPLVYDAVAAHGGSIWAEHGIGELKRDELARYKAPVAIEMMRAIKRALDPAGLMNPGKVL